MPLEYLDLILIAVMLISGLLALMRGFTREVLSLVAWGGAALAGLAAFFSPELKALALQYLNLQPEILAQGAAAAAAFLLALIILSMIGVKLGDLVLDSAIGPFDRTVGFLYGLGRGFLLIVALYLLYIWWVPRESHFTWVRNAVSLPYIEKTGQVVISFLPVDIAETLQGKTYFGTEQNSATDSGDDKANGADAPKYNAEKKRKLDQLIESTQGGSGTQN